MSHSHTRLCISYHSIPAIMILCHKTRDRRGRIKYNFGGSAAKGICGPNKAAMHTKMTLFGCRYSVDSTIAAGRVEEIII